MMPEGINVLRHPVVNSRLADLRRTDTSPKEFRQVSIPFVPRHIHTNRVLLQGIHDISTILAIEATRDLEEEPVTGVRYLL